MTIAAVIVAAGRGTRAGGEIPKQYQNIGGLPVLLRTIRALAGNDRIDQTVVVLHPDDTALFDAVISPYVSSLGILTVEGGENRSESVRNGLSAVNSGTETKVLIHDGARPFVSAALINRLIDRLGTDRAAAPALPVSDALWAGSSDKVQAAVSREALFRAQTPQAFYLTDILKAHQSDTTPAADDVEIARRANIVVSIVEGEEINIKITRPEDFSRAEQFLGSTMDIRCGNGFDVHAFTGGSFVTLCGVQIPHSKGLLGHSDADVAMHAVTDAIYGALAEGDIGTWFPPTDEKWKGAPSHIFLSHAANLATKRGFSINNMDCTIICEHPKIGPHAAKMRTRMAKLLRIDESRVSVKATTSEKLGFTGRGEGIAAQATVTLVK